MRIFQIVNGSFDRDAESHHNFPTRLKVAAAWDNSRAQDRLDRHVKGLTAATNDSGVIFLPDGGQPAVSVYVKASTRTDAARDSIIARIARAAFDAYQ